MISSFRQWLLHLEQHYAERTAFQYWNNGAVQSVTYGQYVQDIRCFVSHLRAMLPQVEGQHVGILARNHYQYAVCLFGILVAGAVAVPLNVEENWDTIQYQIDFSNMVCLFHDGEYLMREPALGDQYGPMLQLMDSVKAELPAEWTEDIPSEDLAMILFTSGTTGRSKGVMLSQKNFFAPLQFFMESVQTTTQMEAARVFFVVPMYHISGIAGILTWTSLGSVLNLCNSMKYLYRDLKAMPSDHVNVVPMILNLWYKDLCRGRVERLGGLKAISCGGASVNADLFSTFQAHGISVSPSYGLTEICGGGTVNWSTDPAKSHSVGLPGMGCQLKLIDGEICLKSDAVMMGYYRDPEATAHAIQDGWLHTGDLGYLDEDGYLYLTGRRKNLIILSNGENVSPEELEQKLSLVPEICEVMVGASKDILCAEIFPTYPTGSTEREKETVRTRIQEAVRTFNHTMPVFKQIQSICFRDKPFAKTASGKLIRYGHSFVAE